MKAPPRKTAANNAHPTQQAGNRASSSPSRHPAMTYRPPRYYRYLRGFFYGLVALLVLAVLYSATWFAGALWLRQTVIAETERLIAEGYKVAYASLEVGGFPSRLLVTFGEPSLSTENRQPSWSWKGERLTLSWWPWGETPLTLETSGRQRLSAIIQSRAYGLSGSVDQLLAQVSAEQAGDLPRLLTVDGRNLQFTVADAPTGRDQLIAKTLEGKLVRSKLAGLDPTTLSEEANSVSGLTVLDTVTSQISLTGHDLTLPGQLALVVGGKLRRLDLTLHAVGPLNPPFEPVRLAAWRDLGGVLEIPQAIIETEQTVLSFSGTLALDKALQPTGSGSAQITGFATAIETLYRNQVINSSEAAMTRLLLTPLVRGSDKAGRSILNLPLNLSGGTIYAGPLPIANIPPIVWPTNTTP